MSQIFISLGTNLGDRKQNLIEALHLLEQGGFKISKKSKVLETEEWRPAGTQNENRSSANDAQPYFNQCIEVESELSPYAVFEILRRIEKKMGRDRSAEAHYKKTHHVPYAPRIIDLDILLYDDWFVREARALKNEDGAFEELLIPHPHLHEREFILKLLNEIAPNIVHPVLHKTIRELS